ncbi:MAG TPA: hypothetical protein VK469_13970 [Candidatus Kapabacteria bacterium]|nr:hypothetical protein [Candidatus Kapabacteria bacterium]
MNPKRYEIYFADLNPTISKQRLKTIIDHLTPQEAHQLRILITEMYGEE